MSDVLVERFNNSNTSHEYTLKENEHKTLIIFNSGKTEATYNLKTSCPSTSLIVTLLNDK